MSRTDQYNLTVSVDGVNLGTFDKKTGGDLDSDEVKYKPGNMGAELSLGGSTMVSNVMVDRIYLPERDPALIPYLKSKVGKGNMVVTQQLLDVNGAPFGAPIVFTGKLKTLKFPEPDSTAKAPGLMSLECSTAGLVG